MAPHDLMGAYKYFDVAVELLWKEIAKKIRLLDNFDDLIQRRIWVN